MKRILAIAILAASFAGCANTSYIHDEYADGKLVSHIEVNDLRNAYDTKAASASLKLIDGTSLELNAPSGQVDPNAMAAIQGVAQAVVTAALAAAKFMGVP